MAPLLDVVPWGGGGFSQWQPWVTPDLRGEFPYAVRLVPILWAIINRIAQDVASVPLRFYRRQRNGRPIEFDPFEPGTPAERWRYANATQSSFELELRRQVSMDQNGRAYLLVDRGRLAKKLSPAQMRLAVLPGHRVETLPAGGDTITGYRFTSPSNGQVLFEPDDLIPFHNWNNDIGIEGLSPLESLRMSYGATRDALRYQRTFYAKGANIGGVFTTDASPGPKVDAAREELKRRNQGVESFADPVILTGDMKFVRRGLTFDEMAFLESMRYTGEEVCRVYGVPPVIMGFKEGGGLSDAGASVDAVRHAEGCIMPRTRLRDAVLTEWYCPLWGDDVYAESDLSVLLAAKKLEMAKAVTLLVGRPIYSVNMGLALLGDEPVDDPEADELYKPPAPSVFGKPGDVAKEKPAAKALREARASDDEFDEGEWRASLADLLIELGEIAGEAALSAALVDAAVDWQKAVVSEYYRHNAAQAIGWLSDGARSELRDKLAELAAPGSTATFVDMVNALREVYSGRRDNAITAAQTEALSANMFATDYAWRESGEVASRAWETAGDEVVRRAHVDVAAAGPVEMGHAFVLRDDAGVEHLAMFPGDPALPGALRINCRCVMTAVLNGDRAARAAEQRGAIGRALARSEKKLLAFFRSMYSAMERADLAKLEADRLSKNGGVETRNRSLLGWRP